MPLTRRVLLPAEWDRLEGTESRDLAHAPADLLDAQPIVVEDDGRIVGAWTFFMFGHAEGCWIHPEHRTRPDVRRALLEGMFAVATERGARVLQTAVREQDLALCRLVRRMQGTELLGMRHFVLPVLGAPCQSV